MRTDFFLPQRWGRARRLCDRPLDHRVHAETGEPLTPDVEEHRQGVAPCKPCTEESASDLDGMGPQRAEPDLAAFPEAAHGGRRAVELERSDVGRRCCGGASPWVVQAQEQSVGTRALEGSAIRGRPDGIAFRLLKVCERGLQRPAYGHVVELGGVLAQCRALPGHEAEAGRQGREAQSPCVEGMAPCLCEGGQKGFDAIDRARLPRHLRGLGGRTLSQTGKA
jgi:hypothetical protein